MLFAIKNINIRINNRIEICIRVAKRWPRLCQLTEAAFMSKGLLFSGTLLIKVNMHFRHCAALLFETFKNILELIFNGHLSPCTWLNMKFTWAMRRLSWWNNLHGILNGANPAREGDEKLGKKARENAFVIKCVWKIWNKKNVFKYFFSHFFLFYRLLKRYETFLAVVGQILN